MRMGARYDRAEACFRADDTTTRVLGAFLLTAWAVRIGLGLGLGLAAVIFAVFAPLDATPAVPLGVIAACLLMWLLWR